MSSTIWVKRICQCVSFVSVLCQLIDFSLSRDARSLVIYQYIETDAAIIFFIIIIIFSVFLKNEHFDVLVAVEQS